jgi:hypothetical protein
VEGKPAVLMIHDILIVERNVVFEEPIMKLIPKFFKRLAGQFTFDGSGRRLLLATLRNRERLAFVERH